jgi:hypothetical protein
MFRFDQFVRRDMVVRDIKREHPETLAVFEDFGFRASCDDCDLETVARKHGLASADVIEALNRAIQAKRASPSYDANHQTGP